MDNANQNAPLERQSGFSDASLRVDLFNGFDQSQMRASSSASAEKVLPNVGFTDSTAGSGSAGVGAGLDAGANSNRQSGTTDKEHAGTNENKIPEGGSEPGTFSQIAEEDPGPSCTEDDPHGFDDEREAETSASKEKDTAPNGDERPGYAFDIESGPSCTTADPTGTAGQRAYGEQNPDKDHPNTQSGGGGNAIGPAQPVPVDN
jgi:hypothetical protein